MRTALYWWRATRGNSWRAALAVALIGGLLGAVALGAVAGARRTASAYGRYLASTNASNALVNIPGIVPGAPVAHPMTVISRLPGVTAGAAYIGLAANPVFGGHVDDAFTSSNLIGSYTGPSFSGEYFGQDRMTVLAGRMPGISAPDQIALSPDLAGKFGVGVGGRVTYQLYRVSLRTGATVPTRRATFRVTAIVDVPPVLVDQSDATNAAVLPPGTTRRVLASYEYAWVGVQLKGGIAGIPELQHNLRSLATAVVQQEFRETHRKLPGLVFNIRSSDIIASQVQQAIRPQAVALTVFGAIAALAMLVLAGQGLAQMLSRAGPDISALRALGATRAQAAAAASLPGAIAVVGAAVLAVAGAIALSPLAPVGPVRLFDPARGIRADGLVLGAGSVLLAAILLAALAVMAARAVRQPAGRRDGRPSAIARAAAAAGLPAAAVVGSRNALEPGSGQRAVPVRAALIGSIAAVTAVVTAVVFGSSLAGLIGHPARYGWNWNIVIQADGGYGSLSPATMSRLIDHQPGVAGWSGLAFGQLPIDGQVIPVLGLQRNQGNVEPPTTSGRPITDNDQIELGTSTLRELGKQIGDTVRVGDKPYQRRMTIAGTVTLPSFGVSLSDHVSLGRGAMLTEAALLAVTGTGTENFTSERQASQVIPSAVAVDLVPGTSTAQQARLVHRITSANPDGTPGGTYQLKTYLAAAIVNASQMGGQPLALALGLAAAAVLSLALTVLASVRRRHRELALLKTLGMTRRQVRTIVAWQTSIVLAVTVIIGVPLGLAAGRWAWNAFAGSLGVAPVTVVPVPALVAGFVVLLAAGNLLALLPAAAAARIPPGITLRAE
jgi:hypothetical protein